MSRKFDPADIPIPTQRPPASAGTIRRGKTLTRPERNVAPVPLITPHNAPIPGGADATPSSDSGWDAWVIFSRVVTFWAPPFMLSSLGGMKDPNVQQAWREKMGLCFIIAILCGIIGFLTVGLQKVLCPEQAQTAGKYLSIGTQPNTLGVQGYLFNMTKIPTVDGVDFGKLLKSPGQDITTLFQRAATDFPACKGASYRAGAEDPCGNGACKLGPLKTTSTLSGLSLSNTSFIVGYDWSEVSALANYFVIDGAVLNMNSYMNLHPNSIPGDTVDAAIRQVLAMNGDGGRDATRLFYFHPDTQAAVPCLVQRYYAGNIDKVTPGCFISQLVLYAGLIVILSLVMVRFIMACIFNWFLSTKLAGPPDTMSLNRTVISPAVMPEGANMSIDNPNGTAPWAGPGGSKKLVKGGAKGARSLGSSNSTLVNEGAAPIMSLAQIGAELFAVCLVTCYSEGEDSLRTTLDSISTTTYSDARKLLFVVADGMITGAGEKRSTPDICVGLLEADPRFGNPVPMAYNAVGTGAKAENRAMIYAGHYSESSRSRAVCVGSDLVVQLSRDAGRPR